MELNIQIYSLIVSLVFGMLFYFLLDLFNKFNKKLKLIFKIVFSILFVLLMAIGYFGILLYINNGCIHIYFLLSIVVGYLIVYLITKKWFTYKKKNNKL